MRLFLSFCVIIIICAGFSKQAQAELRDLPHITVFSASSLTKPMAEITRLYSRDHNITVTASFNAASEQARKIDAGSPADIFISSHPLWMNDLKQRGSIDVFTLGNLVRNRLVLAATAGSRISKHLSSYKNPHDTLSAAIERTLLVLSDSKDTPLGLYSGQAVNNIDPQLWQKLSNRMVRAANAENALYLIAKGQTAGIIYASDAYNNPEVDVIFEFDESLHDPIIYQAAVVAGENMSYARDFLNFLKSKPAARIFLEYGFITE